MDNEQRTNKERKVGLPPIDYYSLRARRPPIVVAFQFVFQWQSKRLYATIARL